MPDKHAYLSASSAERWLHCPGSARLAALFPETHSDAAAEGTLAHSMAQHMIEHAYGEMNDETYEKVMAEDTEAVTKFYKEHKDMTGSADAMKRILEPYVDYCMAEFEKLKKEDGASVLMTEQRVDFSEYVPQGFGTSDVVLIGDRKIVVIDLKYGKGVTVRAQNNPQIRLYAIGALDLFDGIYEFTTVKAVIYQPRLDNVTEEELPAEELKTWAEQVVKPKAKEAAGEHASICPGPWCDDHFCPAAARCKTRANWILKMQQFVKDPELLTDDEMGEVLSRLDALQSFAKKATAYAIDAISNGHPIKGYKIIEGRSQRKYADEDKVAAAAMAAGYDEAVIYNKKIIGITDMTSLMGKKQFEAVLGKLVIKPQEAPKLAPETDPHPAFTPTPTDFDDD